MTEAIAAVTRVFGVLLANMAYVETALVKINKRAARKGIAPLAFSWGKPYAETVLLGRLLDADIPPMARLLPSGDYAIDMMRVSLSLEDRTLKYNGWRFLAALQHLEGENIVRALPGESIPESYRSRGPVCDHCRHVRRRNDTYVLRHDDGRTVQVGSTCMRDFLGTDEAGKLADEASMLSEAGSIGERGESEGSGGSADWDRTLTELLTFVSFVSRANGWVSRTVARENGGAATADTAWALMTSAQSRSDWRRATGEAPIPTEADATAAETSEAWAESLSDETVNSETGDYLHNIRAVARTGLVTLQTAGLGGSILTAWERAMGRARQAKERAERPTCNEYLGTVGAKVTFGLPLLTGKRGQALKNAPTVLTNEALTLDFVTGYQTQFGYTTILKFRTDAGHTVVWKALGGP